MCQNIRKVKNKYTGKELFVPCGHCPACLQDKADKRSLRIQNNYKDDGTQEMYMVTLTYDDKYIPYIRKSDIKLALECNNIDSEAMSAFIDYSDENPYITSLEVPIYRDYDMRWVNCNEKDFFNSHRNLRKVHDNRYMRCKDIEYNTPLQKTIDNLVSTDLRDLSLNSMPCLKSDPDKISVAYYPDLQKFFKRLRITLERNGFDIPISFYACSEYGDKSSRAHFHVLLFAPKGYYTQIKRACYTSWTYDYRKYNRCKFEIALHPASYVATYVNCGHNVPPLVQGSKQRPKHSYSQGFGVGKDVFSLPKVYESFRNGNFTITHEKVRDNTAISDVVPIPKYVISRYAPKFVGYNRLTHDEIFDIAFKPKRLFGYYRKLGFQSPQDCLKVVRMLEKKQKLWLSNNLSISDFALFYSGAWSLYSSIVLKNSHLLFENKKLFQYYYNILDYYTGDLQCDELDNLMFHLPKDFAYEIDPNKFDDVRKRHLQSFQRFHYYKKSKHCNAIAFNDID